MDRSDEMRGQSAREAAAHPKHGKSREAEPKESEHSPAEDRSRLSEIMERVNEALHRGRQQGDREE